MQLTQLKRLSPISLNLFWDDGHTGPVSLHSLRDNCPCAGCQGESVLFQKYVAPIPDRGVPGRYELRGAESIGNYAMKFSWGDGHDQGIYTWDHLRGLCECPECLAARSEVPGG
jgi:DUF971 family protein